MHPPKYSIVIPVYNRPQEVDELLESLTHQTVKNFEVLIIEDGSSTRCEEVVDRYRDTLTIQHRAGPNT
jgi:glycosyltransferase involved in cell wall biosynthesis